MKLDQNGIRRSHRTVTDVSVVTRLLQTARVGYLGLVDRDEPYVVPMNFVWLEERIYLHGAEAGRKAGVIGQSTKAAFTVAEDHGSIANPVPANTSTAYLSAMIFGRLEVVRDMAVATTAMDTMLKKYVPGYFDKPLSQGLVENYVSSMDSHTVVYQLVPDRITAKSIPVDFPMMFYPGRTQKQDLRV